MMTSRRENYHDGAGAHDGYVGVSLLASIIANVAGNKQPRVVSSILKGKSSGISGASYSRRGVRKSMIFPDGKGLAGRRKDFQDVFNEGRRGCRLAVMLAPLYKALQSYAKLAARC